MLSALFFKLGIEQRLREIGLLQAIGFPASKIRRLFLAEGLLLAIIGSLIGLAGAVGYGQFVIVGLRTWWVDAVGTTMLRLHLSPLSLGFGAAGGVIAALACIVWTLRGLGKESTRTLLSGTRDVGQTVKRGVGIGGIRARLSESLNFNFSSSRIGTVLVILALALLIAAAMQRVNQVAGFLEAGRWCWRPLFAINPPGCDAQAPNLLPALEGGQSPASDSEMLLLVPDVACCASP